MSPKSDHTQLALERKLVHLEEYIKEVEAYRDRCLAQDQNMRDACRIERAGFPSATKHILGVIHLILKCPSPVSAPKLPSFLDDLNLSGAEIDAALSDKVAAEQLRHGNFLAELAKFMALGEFKAIKTEMDGLPSPWLIRPELAPRLMAKLESIDVRGKAAWDEMELQAERLLEKTREFVESCEYPSATVQLIQDMLEDAYQARDTMVELLEVGGGNGVPQRTELKLGSPSKEMIAAYRLQFFEGYRTQEAIAAKLSDQFGRQISQGTVSRWIRRVEKWIRAGNVLPDLPGLKREPKSIDPEKLDMGPRQDKRAAHQRERRRDE